MATPPADRINVCLRTIELALQSGSHFRAHAAIDRCFAVDHVDDDDPIAVLPIGSRIVGQLERVGILTVGQLRSTSDVDLSLIRNISVESVRQIRDALATVDAELRGVRVPIE